MAGLTNAERELVALGAALGSNCVPCIQYHIPEARKAGLGDGQIEEAVRLADKVRQVPARKVLAAALGMLQPVATVDAGKAGGGPDPGGSDCAQTPQPEGAGAETPCCA